MQKKIIIKQHEKEQADYQAGIALVKHLYKIGQIKEMPTEVKMLEYWKIIKTPKQSKASNPKSPKKLSPEGQKNLKKYLRETGQLIE